MASKYWRDREAAQLEANIREEALFKQRLDALHTLMERQISLQIADFYQKYANAEGITLAEAQKRISQTDIREYEALAAKYVGLASKDRRTGSDHSAEYFSKQANAQMRLYNAMMKINRLELLKAELGMTVDEAVMDMGDEFDADLTKRTDDEFRRQAGILGTTVFHNNDDVKSIVNGSFHNATWSTRLWGSGDQLKANLNVLLTQGLIQGKNPVELARTLRKAYDVSRYEAERLMRTELARVQSDAQMESFKKNGYDQYEFIALGTACAVCKEMDGEVFNVEDAMPGENLPPVHPNCRCSTAAHFMAENDFVQMMKAKYGLDLDDRIFTNKKNESIIIPQQKEYLQQEDQNVSIPIDFNNRFDDFEPLNLSEQDISILTDIRTRSDDTGYEYGRAKTSNGLSKPYTSENTSKVEIPQDIREQPHATFYHSHTNVTPFSAGDFRLLTSDNVDCIVVIASNRDVYRVTIGGGYRPSKDEFEEFVEMLRPQIDADMLEHPKFFEWTLEERNYMAIREQAYRIAREYKWQVEGGTL